MLEHTDHVQVAGGLWAHITITAPVVKAWRDGLPQERFNIHVVIQRGAPPSGQVEVLERRGTVGWADGTDADLRRDVDREAAVSFADGVIREALRRPDAAALKEVDYDSRLRGAVASIADTVVQSR